MRILLVSMNNLHFRRWSDQLKDSDHEVYWFDILDQGYAPSMSWMTQITGWKKGFLKKRGRSFLKKKLPFLFDFLSKKLDVKVDVAFAKAVKEIQPEAVQSFALYISCTPIRSVMMTHPQIKWIYNAWGSDLYYFQNEASYLRDIKSVLPHINYLFTDCRRDYNIATKLGFKGSFLGVCPGGGGFDLKQFDKVSVPVEQRNTIVVKGYENRSGRAVNVLKALQRIEHKLDKYEIVVFGAENPEVFKFRESEIPNLTIHGMITHPEIIKLLGKAIIYIGNSNSDGLPNTLLEAICAGAFPIQSNPGGATAEVVSHKVNGMLIDNCENVEEIVSSLSFALDNKALVKEAIASNTNALKPGLSRSVIKEAVLQKYFLIENG